MRHAWGRVVTPHGSTTLDGLVGAGLGVADVIGLGVAAVAGRAGDPGVDICLLLVSTGAGVAFVCWRRRRPLRLAAVVVIGYVISGVIGGPGLATQHSGAKVVLVVFAMASWSTQRQWAAAVAVVLGALAILGATSGDSSAVAALSIPTALVGAPWFAGFAARMRRQHLAAVEERLARADAEREEGARRAVADERARIARELHDVVAHHVSLIGVQAGAARTTLGRDDEGTRRALSGIETSSREVVREMRQLLDVLDPDEGRTPLGPPPRTADFVELCDGFRAAGLAVELRTSGDLGSVPTMVALTLYRIVEEALTNISRHSQASTSVVTVEVSSGDAALRVDDPGPSRPRAPVPPRGAGRGLAGMRARVDVCGGTLVAERSGPGFVVSVVVPWSRT